ncbi:MAG: AraC family transcriptional regulator [Lentisphaeria bacterium]|nr:AraC family transcriptional regulator [Lentisphaeria bacterium]
MSNFLSFESFRKQTGQLVTVYSMEEQLDMELHFHDYTELVFILSGKGIHFTKEDEHDIKAGQVLVIRPKEAHGFKQCNELKLINLIFRQKHLRLSNKDLHYDEVYQHVFDKGNSPVCLSPTKLEWNFLMHKLNEVKLELSMNHLGYQSYLNATLEQLLIILLRSKAGSKQIYSKASKLILIERYIHEHIAMSIRASDITRAFHISNSTLQRLFLKDKGMRFTDYLNRVRVEYAKSLLKDHRFSIAEVGRKCSFLDSNYFSKVFKMYTGFSPTVWRRQLSLQK